MYSCRRTYLFLSVVEQLGSGKEAIQAIGSIPYINKKWLDFLVWRCRKLREELEQVLIAFRDNGDRIQQEFNIEGSIIPMSGIINNGDQDPAIFNQWIWRRVRRRAGSFCGNR